MRQISDELAFIGSPLTDNDLVSSVLNGLGAEYNPFVIAVTTASRHTPLSFADLHGLLLSHEHLLQGQSTTSSLPSVDSPATFATRPAPQQRSFSSLRLSNPLYSQQRYNRPHPAQVRPSYYSGLAQYRPNFSGSFPAQGFRSAQSNGPRPVKPQCQICMKIGHTAKICYYRFSEDRNAAAV